MNKNQQKIISKSCQKYWDNNEYGDLKFCRNFGKYISKIYGHLFPFNKNKVCVKSSETRRDIESAKHFIKGLFSDKSFDIDVIIDNEINRYSNMASEEINLCGKNIKLNFDGILRYVNESDIYRLNNKINKLFDYNIESIEDYLSVYYTLQCYNINNKNLIPTEWNKDDDTLLQQVTTYFYSKIFENNQITSLLCDDLLSSIYILSKNDKINFIYMSIQDSIIYHLAFKLSNTVVKLPNFYSCIRYEIWDRITRIYYDDLLITEFP